jgi:ribonuclease R
MLFEKKTACFPLKHHSPAFFVSLFPDMSKHKKPARYLFEEVLDFLRHNGSKSFNYKQLGAAMEMYTETERDMLVETLDSLKEQGFIVEADKGKYQIKESKEFLTGTIDFTSQGTAFVVFSETQQDIFIQNKKTRDALQGDLVKVQIIPRRGGKRKEGEVVEVIKRSKTEFVGTIKLNPNFAFVVPDSHKIHVDFFVRNSDTMGAKDGQKVIVELKEWKESEQNPSAKVTEVLGNPGEHQTEMNAIIAEYGLPEDFPDDVEYEARQLPVEITAEEVARRRDFRGITTFTIDPVDAKDFDDALSIRKLDNGMWEVGVHIADVTHYLKPHTKLDKEAVNRATSVYLVDRVIPMLPEVLSNFVCSLRPAEEKYCFSAVFQLDDEAVIHDQWFGKTIIYSDRRFAYEDVQKIIETGEGDYKDEIAVLNRLATKLRHERMRQGSIFFDKAEVKFHLDEEGNPTGVFFKTQQEAHKLIEDFMLLANRRVAEYLGKNGAPEEQQEQGSKRDRKGKNKNVSVYRVHDVPSDEKMQDLSGFVARFGYEMNVGDRKKIAKSINKLLADVKNKREQGMIELLAVRSMPKAIYTTKNVGHYGLGFEYYTHFTSPIRRYPDVLVHRLLEAKLAGKTYANEEELEFLSKHSSEMERMAAEAERASVKYKQVEFMKDKVGQEFDGTITGVTEWGIYAEINENKCEGMIRSRDLRGDQFTFDEDNYRYVGRNTNKMYSLGDAVKIVVLEADLVKKQLSYGFAEMQGDKLGGGQGQWMGDENPLRSRDRKGGGGQRSGRSREHKGGGGRSKGSGGSKPGGSKPGEDKSRKPDHKKRRGR